MAVGPVAPEEMMEPVAGRPLCSVISAETGMALHVGGTLPTGLYCAPTIWMIGQLAERNLTHPLLRVVMAKSGPCSCSTFTVALSVKASASISEVTRAQILSCAESWASGEAPGFGNAVQSTPLLFSRSMAGET